MTGLCERQKRRYQQMPQRETGKKKTFNLDFYSELNNCSACGKELTAAGGSSEWKDTENGNPRLVTGFYFNTFCRGRAPLKDEIYMRFSLAKQTVSGCISIFVFGDQAQLLHLPAENRTLQVQSGVREQVRSELAWTSTSRT